MCEQEFRCDYLTPAFWSGATSSKSAVGYREILTDALNPEDLVERVKSALTSGYTLAVFNGSVAFGSLDAQDAEILFTDLRKAFDQCSQVDLWEEQGGGATAADLALTLNLIQMEILESIGRSGLAKKDALSLLISALQNPEDSLHFAALEALHFLGSKASSAISDLQDYLDGLGRWDLSEESIPLLRDAVFKTLKVFGHD